MVAAFSPARDWRLLAALVAVVALALVSITIGVYDLDISRVLAGSESLQESLVLVASRIPRTVAIILVGISMSVAGLIMQLLAQNRFVSPSTAGTIEASSLGILTVTLLTPGMPLLGKMLVASLFALAGTGVFLGLLRAVPLRTPLVVPLIGIMFGQVIASVTTFFAYRYDLLQSLAAWTGGDFSRVLRGRYELLWLSGGLTVIAFIAADRFTVAGLGEAFTTNLGLNYQRVLFLGLSIVSVVTAVNVVTIGAIPFLGLIVPNVVRIIVGDNVRRTAPWCALFGAGFLLLCDIAGRVIRYPYEIPIGTVVGVVGSVVFLALLLRTTARVG
ncbi:MAG: iron chelate uptake ABC transporter family permease subunit [Thermomicrobiales bacterium]|nr:iron chelate uptake ABC transporter family permease subunit [Thermomicrobiales bacterium]